MHKFHPYDAELPQIITSFKGNQKLILGGYRYNIHHVKEGVKTWRCVCAKKLTGTRSWCKGRAETWDSDTKGLPKGEHNHPTEHELAELEYFKSQMILAAISEPTADLSVLIDAATKFLSEGLNFGNRESMKKSLLVARKSVESGEFALGKQRTVTASTVGGKKKGTASTGSSSKPTTNAQNATTTSDPTAIGTVHSKSVSGRSSSRLSVSLSAVPMPSSSSKFTTPSSPFKLSAVAPADGTAASFDTSGASCSNTSGYGTMSSSSVADEDAAAHGIGWMDLSGESGNILLPEQLNQTNSASTAINGIDNAANMFGVQSSSSTDHQQLLAAALFAAAMLGNPSTTPATTIAATLSTTLANNTNTVGRSCDVQQQTVGNVMMSMMLPSSESNNKATKRISARSSALSGAASRVRAVQQAQQSGCSSTALGTFDKNSRSMVMNVRKKTARVNCILNKLSTKAAETSVSPPSPSSNTSESCQSAKLTESAEQDGNSSALTTVWQTEKKHSVTVATQTDEHTTIVDVETVIVDDDNDTVVNGGDEQQQRATRKRKSDVNDTSSFGREQQQQQNADNNVGTEKRKVVCCCCYEESELSDWEMPLGCKRRVLLKMEHQNGTTTTKQQMAKKEQQQQEQLAIEQENNDSDDEELFGIGREIKLEIAEEDEEQQPLKEEEEDEEENGMD